LDRNDSRLHIPFISPVSHRGPLKTDVDIRSPIQGSATWQRLTRPRSQLAKEKSDEEKDIIRAVASEIARAIPALQPFKDFPKAFITYCIIMQQASGGSRRYAVSEFLYEILKARDPYPTRRAADGGRVSKATHRRRLKGIALAEITRVGKDIALRTATAKTLSGKSRRDLCSARISLDDTTRHAFVCFRVRYLGQHRDVRIVALHTPEKFGKTTRNRLRTRDPYEGSESAYRMGRRLNTHQY